MECERCEKDRIETVQSSYDNGRRCEDSIVEVVDSTRKCSEWLESCSISSDIESEYSATDTTTTDTTESSALDVYQNANNVNTDISDIFNKPLGKYRNIGISNSKRVHLGSVTYINGPVHIHQNILNINGNSKKDEESTERESVVEVNIIDRRSWLAQPPIRKLVPISEPAKYVIICHTASEEALKDVFHLRFIQEFYMDEKQLDDIAYNFLISMTGMIFQGRGWLIEGAHTVGFNDKSVGIAFIGSCEESLPTRKALQVVKDLIDLGVTEGAVSPYYRLLAQCQVANTTSPGKRLFEELKTWERWDPFIASQT